MCLLSPGNAGSAVASCPSEIEGAVLELGRPTQELARALVSRGEARSTARLQSVCKEFVGWLTEAVTEPANA